MVTHEPNYFSPHLYVRSLSPIYILSAHATFPANLIRIDFIILIIKVAVLSVVAPCSLMEIDQKLLPPSCGRRTCRILLEFPHLFFRTFLLALPSADCAKIPPASRIITYASRTLLHLRKTSLYRMSTKEGTLSK